MPPGDLVLTEHAQWLKLPRGLIVLVDEPINTTRALRTDQSKEEKFASIIEVSKAYTVYTDTYSYYCALVLGYYVFTVYR